MNACHKCGCDLTPADNNAIPYAQRMGYGTDENGNKICYECCGHADRLTLRNMPLGGKFTGYLTGPRASHVLARVGGSHWEDGPYQFTNWPESLTVAVSSVKVSRHNMSGRRLDFWVKIEGNYFHGVQVMTNGDLATLTRVKAW